MQYFFQAMGACDDARIRDLLMSTATEDLWHIEMMAYAVALNLEGAPLSYQEASAKDPVVNAILSGMNPCHILFSGPGSGAQNEQISGSMPSAPPSGAIK